MAATIAKATGIDKSRTKCTHRLGHEAASVEAATFKTFASAYITRDGSGYVSVRRDGQEIHRFNFPSE